MDETVETTEHVHLQKLKAISEKAGASKATAKLEDDPKTQHSKAEAEKIQEELRLWQVVGKGGDGQGITVREYRSIKSPLMNGRLSKGAIIREIKIKDDRLAYQLIEGEGPKTGWVSVKCRDGTLLKAVDAGKVAKKIAQPIQRLSMLPKEMRDLANFDLHRSAVITQNMYGHVSALTNLANGDSKKWLKRAMCRDFDTFDVACQYPAFPAEDATVSAMLKDSTLKPLNRVFPAPPKEKRSEEEPVEGQAPQARGRRPRSASPNFRPASAEARMRASSPGAQPDIMFYKTLQPAHGLLPDALSVLYFINDSKSALYGAVRFLTQSTVSMNRNVSQAEGEFYPTAHEGAQTSLLYDAANYFARLVWRADATPTKISCEFLDRCPTHQTLTVSAAQTSKESDKQCTVMVYLNSGSTQIATAEVVFDSLEHNFMTFPSCYAVRDVQVSPPNLDWVPPEMTNAKLGQASKGADWDAKGYKDAAFDEVHAMSFPDTLNPQEEEDTLGLPRHVSASKPSGKGGAFASDLSFSQGLVPAAISNFKWYDGKDAYRGVQFTGKAKFGPQASEAMFLTGTKGGLQGHVDGGMSLAADLGLSLAVLNEFLSQLPRCSCDSATSIKSFEAKVNGLIPIGCDVDVMSYFPTQTSDSKEHLVRGNMECGGQLLVSATAVVVSQ